MYKKKFITDAFKFAFSIETLKIGSLASAQSLTMLIVIPVIEIAAAIFFEEKFKLCIFKKNFIYIHF